MRFTSLLSALAAVTAATAVTVPKLGLAARDSCVETCGSNCYSQSAIDAALSQGYGYYEDGETVGSDKYPHTYHDYEGFSFPVDGPYEEFPILADGDVYTGGSPGADRVIFNTAGNYAGLITHTGASGDDFVECD